MPYYVFAVSSNKKNNSGKIPHARRIKEERITEVARGNEVFNLRRRSNMSTTKTRETWNSVGNILPERAVLISPRVQICALLRVLCAHTSSRTARAAKTPVIARILQRLPLRVFLLLSLCF